MSPEELKQLMIRIAFLEDKCSLLQEQINKIKNEIYELNSIARKEAVIIELADKDNPYINKDIQFLDLSVRASSCLKRASCKTIADILVMGSNLFHVRNLGMKSAREILISLKELGFNVDRFDFEAFYKEKLL